MGDWVFSNERSPEPASQLSSSLFLRRPAGCPRAPTSRCSRTRTRAMNEDARAEGFARRVAGAVARVAVRLLCDKPMGLRKRHRQVTPPAAAQRRLPGCLGLPREGGWRKG